MNNKVQIWKRKLAKEHCKQQMRMWDRLKYEPNITIERFTSSWKITDTQLKYGIEDDVADDLAKMISDHIDKEILQSLTNDSKTEYN